MANKLVFSKFQDKVLVIDSRKQAVGSITYYGRWKRHVFIPTVGIRLSSEHLTSINENVQLCDRVDILKPSQEGRKGAPDGSAG